MGWGRRREIRPLPSEPSALGCHLNSAVLRLSALSALTVKHTVKPDYTLPQLLPWIFPDDTLRRLRDAYGYTEGANAVESYPVHAEAEIVLDFSGYPILTPTRDCLKVDADKAGPLMNTIEQVKAVHHNFAVAKNVLHWLDKNCTLGAMRYYYPTILALTTDVPGLSVDMPKRHNAPKTPISPLLPLIRESATTVATALLMEKMVTDQTERVHNNLLIAVDGGVVRRPEGDITVEQQTYHMQIDA